MEQSAIRDFLYDTAPHFAALHASYGSLLPTLLSSPGIAVRRTASLSLAYVPVISILGAQCSIHRDGRDKPGHDPL